VSSPTDLRLTPTSYVVLGLVESLQPATPYDLKRAAREGVANLWALPHTQLYSESARLAEAGLLHEEREPAGRRRRIYRISDLGSRTLEEWRRDTSAPGWELRDAGLLKLYFGADPQELAETQLESHRKRLEEYESQVTDARLAPGMRLALASGIGHEREYMRFWDAIAAGETL
jgi:DNA-binding PadR family transcriptional regulator